MQKLSLGEESDMSKSTQLGLVDGWQMDAHYDIFGYNDRNPTQSDASKKGRKNEDLVMFLNSPGSHFQEQLNQGTQVISSGLSPSYPISELWFSLCWIHDQAGSPSWWQDSSSSSRCIFSISFLKRVSLLQSLHQKAPNLVLLIPAAPIYWALTLCWAVYIIQSVQQLSADHYSLHCTGEETEA